MIRFTCHSCDKNLKVDAKYAGRRVQCPRCQEKLRVPQPDDAGDSSASSEPPPSAKSPKTSKPPKKAEVGRDDAPQPDRTSAFDELLDDTDDTPPPPSVRPEDLTDRTVDQAQPEPAAPSEPKTPDPSPPEVPTLSAPLPVRREPLHSERLSSSDPPLSTSTPFGGPLDLSADDAAAWEEWEEDRRRQKPATPEDELDMTPMVDVTFLLLIFFMITASFQLQQSLKAEAPESEQEAAASAATDEEPEEEPIIVEVSEKNLIYVDGRQVALPEIGEALSQLKTDDPRVELMIEIDRSALHGTVVEVVNAANAVGIEKVARSSVGG